MKEKYIAEFEELMTMVSGFVPEHLVNIQRVKVEVLFEKLSPEERKDVERYVRETCMS